MLSIDIKSGEKQDIKILALEGEFDLYEKEKVQNLLPQILSDNPSMLIIDLTGISLLASAGIEIILLFQTELTRLGKQMALVVDHNNYLINKFRRLGIFEGTELKFFETVKEAESSLIP